MKNLHTLPSSHSLSFMSCCWLPSFPDVIMYLVNLLFIQPRALSSLNLDFSTELDFVCH